MKKLLLALTLVVTLASSAFSQDNNGSRLTSAANEPLSTLQAAPSGTASSFFALDVDGFCCSNPNNGDPWPFTLNSAVSGITFATWRSLGSGVTWAQISPCNPTQTSCSLAGTWICNSSNRCYNWGSATTGNGLDGLIALAQQYGQAIMFTATGTPAWISSNTNDGCHPSGSCSPPSDLSTGDTTWKNFLADLIAHEGVGKIKYLEIWNEPNNTGSWVGTQSQLETMIQDAHAAAKAADSGIKIISSPITADFATQPYPNCAGINHWLADLLKLGMGSYVDIIGFHGYVALNNTSYLALDASCVGNVVSTVRSALKTANIAGSTPIYDTEGSWLKQYESTIDPSEEASFTGIFYLVQASSICTSSPCYPLVGFSWYGWDFDGSTGALWNDSNSPGFTNAGIAYVNLYKWLTGATPVSQCSRATNGTWTCNYTRAGGYMARAVWTDSSSCSSGCSYTYPSWANYSRDLVDLNDTDVALSGGTVTIGYTPILLESAPLP